MEMMKAVRVKRFGGPETITVQRIPKPTPHSGELLVRVEAAAVNPIDWKLREGLFKDLALPFTPGADFCGVVERLGPGVEAFEKGDSVYGVARGSMGADAEFVAAPQGSVALRPRTLSPIEAACVPVVGLTAWQGLFTQGALKAGQTVLILGASGGVGSMAVQLAKLAGARVLATAATENVERVRGLGADQVIDYKKQRVDEAAEDVDLCLDLVGGDLQKRGFLTVKLGGRLISTVQPPDEALAASRGVMARFLMMKPDADQLRQLAVKIDAGEIRVEVAKILPFERAAEAEELNRRHGVEGKIVLRVQ